VNGSCQGWRHFATLPPENHKGRLDYMKNILSRLFGGGEKKANALPASEGPEKSKHPFMLQSTPEQAKEHSEGMREAFTHAIANSPYIKTSMRERVLAYMNGEVEDLLKEGTLLTTEEKKSIGLSPRAKITRESLELLTQDAIAAGHTPGQVLEVIRCDANREYYLKSSIHKMRNMGVKRYSVSHANTGIECEWCRSLKNVEFDISQDFFAIAEENCKNSPRCVVTTKPILDWD